MSDSPKTQAGNRTLPIPRIVEPYVIEQMQYSKDLLNNEEGLLFKPPIVHYARVSSLNWQLKNIRFISSTFLVSNLSICKDDKEMQFANIFDISVTLGVSNFAKFNEFNEEQPLNINDIDVTAAVSNLSKFKEVNFAQL